MQRYRLNLTIMRVFNSKKAAVEVQIGWIFVLIVGSLILLFFISVVRSTTKSSQESKYVDLKQSLQSILAQAESDVGTTRTIGMPSIALEFDCTGFNIQNAQSGKISTTYNTIFSPDIIQGREMVTKSQYFEMPYKVDYFLYATSKSVRYTFVNYSASCNHDCQKYLQDIIKELPANMTLNFVSDASTVHENGYYKERFIFLNQDPTNFPIFSGMKNSDMTAIKISSLDNSIYYYNKTNTGWSTPSATAYLGTSMLIGAIISEESLYECNARKALVKYKILTTLYANRTQVLKDFYYQASPDSAEYVCYQKYDQLNIASTINSLDQFINGNKFDSSAFNSISSTADLLKQSNEKTLMILSCPLIY